MTTNSASNDVAGDGDDYCGGGGGGSKTTRIMAQKETEDD